MNAVNYAMTYAYVHGKSAANRVVNSTKKRVSDFVHEERGAADFIAIVLIIVVVIALVVIFRANIMQILKNIWDKIFDDAKTATDGTQPTGTTTGDWGNKQNYQCFLGI